ncbi:hypothetical protein SDC9_145863 [bioreactor metagenome]|uniref:GGDEF domain-containing protein n=1 Tax=bioreactor metagenome TaxID=1076179 RepID=A0A645EB15_9ZZZZ
MIDNQDGAVLYSSLAESGEDFAPGERTPAHEGDHYGAAQTEGGRTIRVGRNQAAYEITSVPVIIGDRDCMLEMIQPYRRVISAVTGAPMQSFDGEEYLSSTIGGMLLKDTLTGLYNRRYIDEYLPGAISAACDRGMPLSLIFADIDQFKLVNDRYGHVAGDLVLQHIAGLLKKSIRRTDSWVARYGGDEFIICLPGVENTAAHRIANRIRVAVMNERFPLVSGSISLTCSFGVHTVGKSDFQLSALMLLHRADEKLYQAKRAGRNKVF